MAIAFTTRHKKMMMMTYVRCYSFWMLAHAIRIFSSFQPSPYLSPIVYYTPTKCFAFSQDFLSFFVVVAVIEDYYSGACLSQMRETVYTIMDWITCCPLNSCRNNIPSTKYWKHRSGSETLYSFTVTNSGNNSTKL